MEKQLSTTSRPEHPFRYSFTTCFKERVIVNMLAPQPGKKILEMGCGSAYFSTVLAREFPNAKFEYVGVDVSEPSLEAAKNYLDQGSKVVKGSVTELPFGDATFDDVIYLDVIEHVDDDVKSLKEAYRVLKPGGRLIVSTPNLNAVFTDTFFCEYMHDHGTMENQRPGYSPMELEKKLKQAGFQIEDTDFSNVFLSELMITATKLGYRLLKPKYASQADVVEVSDSILFKLHKKFVFPMGYLLGRAEEMGFKKLIKGHCLITLARKKD